jgi:4-carboxymuconolactone decarboxylase
LPRIPLVSPDAMTDDQRRVYQNIVTGPRQALVGPLRAALHNPELAERWQQLGEILRFRTSLPPRISELAILVVARRWNSQVEWYIHSEAARKAGLPDSTIEAIRHARSPKLETPAETAIYEFVRQLQEYGQVEDEIYDEVQRELDVVGTVEIVALIGYYTMVSITLNAHQIPLPDSAEPPLQPVAGQNCAETKTSPGVSRLTRLAQAQPSSRAGAEKD